MIVDSSRKPTENAKQTIGLVPRSDAHAHSDSSGQLCSADLRRDDLTGLSLAQYALGKKIGEGGMGHVYIATHVHLGKQFAIKFIRPELMGSEAKNRFLNEIQSIGNLTHPHLVNAVDAGQNGQLLYCVTDYMIGSDVGELIRTKGTLPIQAAAELIRQAAIGLDYAHQRGYVHRDIKPNNLFVESNANVRILDFGIAKHEDTNEKFTRADQLLGTVDFISPEQASNASRATPQSDLYSLGATLAYVLTGELLYPDASYPTVTNKLAAIVTQTPSIVESSSKNWPKPIQVALAKTLALDPTQRFENARQLAQVLEPIASLEALQQWLKGCEVHDCSSNHANRTTFKKVNFFNSTQSKLATAASLLLVGFVLFATLTWTSPEKQSDGSEIAVQAEATQASNSIEQKPAPKSEKLISTDSEMDPLPERITVVPRKNSTSNANAIGVRMKATAPLNNSRP